MKVSGIGVYQIITLSWGLISASFAPTVLYRLTNGKLDSLAAVIGAIFGIITAIAWSNSSLAASMYEALPAVAVSLLTATIVNKAIKK